MKIKKIIISIIIVLVVIIGAGTIGIGNYFYNLAINPNTSKEKVFGNESDESVEASSQVTRNWILDEISYEDKYIISDDDLKLHGYEIKNNDSNVWVITIHGYMGEGSHMDSYAQQFYNMGYNVLVPDLRSHGKSEGDYIGMGWDDHYDIKKWINYIIENDSDADIILHGVSMGGATVMMTSGEELPSNVKALIEDCGYTSAEGEFGYQLERLFNLPKTPILQISSLVTKFRAGYWFGQASSIEQLKKANRPMLFIHGSADEFVPFSMLDEVYDVVDIEKEKLVIEGAEHTKAAETNPELYWSTVSEFINKYI